MYSIMNKCNSHRTLHAFPPRIHLKAGLSGGLDGRPAIVCFKYSIGSTYAGFNLSSVTQSCFPSLFNT